MVGVLLVILLQHVKLVWKTIFSAKIVKFRIKLWIGSTLFFELTVYTTPNYPIWEQC